MKPRLARVNDYIKKWAKGLFLSGQHTGQRLQRSGESCCNYR